jgi:hypothetical protein
MIENVVKYIQKCLNLDDCSQLYYKLIDDKLFLVYIEIGHQRDYWNENPLEFLPFAFKEYDLPWDCTVSMGLTPEQEGIVFLGHEDWPESFPKLCEMTKYLDKTDLFDTTEDLNQIKKQIVLGLELKQEQVGNHPLHEFEEEWRKHRAEAISQLLNEIPTKEELADLLNRLEQYDILTTKIRNILTEVGIPDHEKYPDDEIDDREKSLRTGGRMIPLDKRVKMLIDNYAKTIANMHPSKNDTT